MITDRPCGWISYRSVSSPRGAQKLIVHDGLTGVTSNPSIFEKAIAGSADYDSLLNAVEAAGRLRCDVAL